MIALLKGKVISKNRNEIILDVSGVGYQIFISKKVSELIESRLNEESPEFQIHTFLDVKENSLTLYGFTDVKEKEMFRLLVSVNGIGPKMAHTILSNVSFEEIVSLITGSSFMPNVKIPGIGSKKLELISMTLKDKIYRIDKDADMKESVSGAAVKSDSVRFEALSALMNLGYLRNEAEKIIREVLKTNEPSKDLTTEEIIRKALEYISK